jgi:outer membrane protein assembly factor BamB
MSLVATTSTQTSVPPNPGAGRYGKNLPLSPFPSRTHFTLALNNQLTAPPAYDARFGYFPIEGDRIVAYDLLVGMQRWIVSAKPRSAPTVGGDLLFIDREDGISALHTSDGSMAWTAPLPKALVAPPVWDHGWLIAVTASELIAFRAADGSPVWRHDVTGVRAAPAIDADRLYVSLDDKRVVAFRIDTGARLWERRLGGPPNEILAAGDRLFVGSNDNYLYCLKAEDGTIEWRWQTGADVVSKPLADRDRVYFVSLDNVLRALNRRNGVQQWKRPLPFRPSWPPVRAADTVVVAGIAGSARAFLLKDGAPAGELTTEAGTEIVAPFHTFPSVATLGPMVIAVTHTIAEGATIVAVSRSIEPAAAPLVPLPGILPVAIPKTQ